MFVLLLGSDDFGKNEYIREYFTGAVLFSDSDNPPKTAELMQQNLFGVSRIYILKNIFSKILWPDNIDNLANSSDTIVIVEEKLDGRLNISKKILNHEKTKQLEFFLLHGKELDQWLEARAKKLGGSISQKAASVLAEKLGRDDFEQIKEAGKPITFKEKYSLWQADGEMRKLLAFCSGREIEVKDVESLVYTDRQADAFKISDAISKKDKKNAFLQIRRFIETSDAGDEKSAIIQLAALLGEQFRAILAVKEMLAQKWSDQSILQATGWKSGRLFMVKKNAMEFEEKTVKAALFKLSALDLELKTSSGPAGVVLDLIVSQML